MPLMHNLDRRRARQILVAQAVTTLVAMLVGFFFGPSEGFYALIGGAIALIANLLFAFWVFGRYRADEPGKLAGQFYSGEFVKLGFVALAFAAVILLSEAMNPLAFFGAFFVVQVIPPLLANRIAG
jgi:ATP synthase protein I